MSSATDCLTAPIALNPPSGKLVAPCHAIDSPSSSGVPPDGTPPDLYTLHMTQRCIVRQRYRLKHIYWPSPRYQHDIVTAAKVRITICVSRACLAPCRQCTVRNQISWQHRTIFGKIILTLQHSRHIEHRTSNKVQTLNMKSISSKLVRMSFFRDYLCQSNNPSC